MKHRSKLAAILLACLVLIPLVAICPTADAQCVNGICRQPMPSPAFVQPVVMSSPAIVSPSPVIRSGPSFVSSPLHSPFVGRHCIGGMCPAPTIRPVCYGGNCRFPSYAPPGAPYRYQRSFGISFNSSRSLSPWVRR